MKPSLCYMRWTGKLTRYSVYLAEGDLYYCGRCKGTVFLIEELGNGVCSGHCQACHVKGYIRGLQFSMEFWEPMPVSNHERIMSKLSKDLS